MNKLYLLTRSNIFYFIYKKQIYPFCIRIYLMIYIWFEFELKCGTKMTSEFESMRILFESILNGWHSPISKNKKGAIDILLKGPIILLKKQKRQLSY
jgi:hypothetical protein